MHRLQQFSSNYYIIPISVAYMNYQKQSKVVTRCEIFLSLCNYYMLTSQTWSCMMHAGIVIHLIYRTSISVATRISLVNIRLSPSSTPDFCIAVLHKLNQRSSSIPLSQILVHLDTPFLTV